MPSMGRGGDSLDEVEEFSFSAQQYLELGRQWKVTVFYTFCLKRRVRIFNTKNLYGNDT
jgi:hypothetical protein